MAVLSWTFRLEDGVHTVRLEHGYWSGRRILHVDGERIVDETKFYDTGSEHSFICAGHPCKAEIDTSNGLIPVYRLTVDGRLVEQQTSQPAETLLRPASAPSEEARTLLRPAGAASETDPELLLRPSDGDEGMDTGSEGGER